MKTRILFQIAASLCLFVASNLSSRGQWITETNKLKAGWNSVYLHIECPQATIGDLVGIAGPIEEIWLWNPSPTLAQFFDSAQNPTGSGSQWLSWKRSEVNNQFDRLLGNSAYLVRASADHDWKLKGKPVPPRYNWSTTGLNFIGFPMAPNSPANFEVFFEHVPTFRSELELYYYTTAELGTANNPKLLTELSSKLVRRNEAYWLRAGSQYNKYFGPFEVTVQGSLDFGDSIGQRSFRIRNMALTTNVITLKYLASELPVPAGQRAIVATPLLMVRGAFNVTNSTHAYSNLAQNGILTWTLPPHGTSGSEVEVVLGVNRYAMNHQPGDYLAGILRLTDYANYSQIDLPLSVEMNSTAGLWVGAAALTSVNSYLKTYQKSDDGVLSQDSQGKYIATATNLNSAPVKKPFPLRLIVHHDGTNAALLQRVFYGLNTAGNPIVTLKESSLDPAQLTSARRISAPHLPWSSASPAWALAGTFKAGSSLNLTVAVGHGDHASNPFLHTYHPDHDNLDATFGSTLAQGNESFGITRKIFLVFTPPADDFASLTESGASLGGTYAEEMKLGGNGTENRTFYTDGFFLLKRISPIAQLTP